MGGGGVHVTVRFGTDSSSTETGYGACMLLSDLMPTPNPQRWALGLAHDCQTALY